MEDLSFLIDRFHNLNIPDLFPSENTNTSSSAKKELGPLSLFAWTLYRSSNLHNINIGNELNQNSSYNLVTLSVGSTEYQTVRTLFMSTAPPNYTIHKIERIDNSFLYGCYQLKKEELKLRYGNVKEINVYHGTKSHNISSICQNNFNWRLFGRNKGNRFGKGVSFSQYAYYASHYYCRDYKGDFNINKIFIVKMAYSHLVPGSDENTIPPGYVYTYTGTNKPIHPDTTYKDIGRLKEKKDVLVKFSDHEFYPAYIVHYSGRLTFQMRQMFW